VLVELLLYDLLATKGRKAELAWLADPRQTVYPQSGHLSTIDRAQGTESPPIKDGLPNH